MSSEDRAVALRTLRSLLLGARCVSLRFVGEPELFFDRAESGEVEAFIRIGGGCRVVSGSLPWDRVVEPRTRREVLVDLVGLAQKRVSGIDLSEDVPNLTITFDGAECLMVSGADPGYESWEVGAVASSTLVVATPGGDVAVWE